MLNFQVGGLVDKILAQLKNVSDLQDRMFKMEKRMNEVIAVLFLH